MSKLSTATVRKQPVAASATSSGQMVVQSESFEIVTNERLEIRDLTDEVMARVRALPVHEGLLHVFSAHTTCTIVINEMQDALKDDYRTFLGQLASSTHPWRHNDPEVSACDRGNADAHMRALTMSHSVTLQISGGEVVLGTWQRILAIELDGPRTRTLRLQVMGVA